jgi:arginase family enzyme
VLSVVRDLYDGERKALELSDVTVVGSSPVETLVAVKNALDGAPVYIHLDLDVLDPAVFPAREPAPGGLAPEKLYDLLEAVTGDCELVGVEVTTFEAPAEEEDRQEASAVVMRVLEPLLESIPAGANVGG